MKVRLTNLTIECDVELLSGALVPTTPQRPPAPDPPPVVVVPVVVDPVIVPEPPPPPPPPPELPVGFNFDTAVALRMLETSMQLHGLTAVAVQRHGDWIINALKADYPALDVYVSSQDAIVWPGFGSLDVTINSGLGGFYFRPDGAAPWKPVGQR